MTYTLLLFADGFLSQHTIHVAVDPTTVDLAQLKSIFADVSQNSSVMKSELSVTVVVGATKHVISSDEELRQVLISAPSDANITFDATVVAVSSVHEEPVAGATHSRPVTVVSHRAGDFFAEVKESLFDAPSSRGGILDVLKAHVKSQHSDIRPDAVVTLRANVEHETVPLTSDSVVENLLESLLAEGKKLTVEYETTSPQSFKSIAVRFILDDFSHKEADAEFRFSGSEQLLVSLKQLAVGELELDVGTQVNLFVVADGEEQSIPSDRALSELLSVVAQDSSSDRIRFIVRVFQRSVRKRVNVHALRRVDGAGALSSGSDEVSEFVFEFAVDQERLLASLKDAVRHGFDIHSQDALDVAAVFEAGEDPVPLPSDKFLLNALTELLQPGATLHLVVTQPKVVARSNVLHVEVSHLERVASFDFTFSLEETNVVAHLRHDASMELERDFADDDVLVFVDSEGCDAPIVSDAVLRDIVGRLIESAAEPNSALKLTIVVKQSTGRNGASPRKPVSIKREVHCTLSGETAVFPFSYSLEDENLLRTLLEEARDAHDLMPNENVLLDAKFESDYIPLRNDRDLREFLHQLNINEALHLTATLHAKQQPKVVTIHTRSIACTLDGETANFQMRFVMDQDGLLDCLLSECRHELDLLPNEGLLLSAVIGTDEVPLTSDGVTREILSLDDDATLTLVASHPLSGSHSGGKKQSVRIEKSVRCTLGDETATFTYRFDVAADGLLDDLIAECKDQLDLMPNEALKLYLSADGEEALLATDGMLRELLTSVDGDMTLRAEVIVARRPAAKRLVAATLNGETANFSFSYQVDQDNLLQSLIDECKGELDLLPNEVLVLTVVIGGDAIALKNDRELREILSQFDGDSEALKLMAEVVKPVAGSPVSHAKAQSVTLKFEAHLNDDTADLVFRFQRSEENLVESLAREFRDAFERNPAEQLQLLASVDDAAPHALRNDDHVRALVLPDTHAHRIVIIATLPKTEQEVAEEKPLNRRAEINALLDDWLDIITSATVDAGDLKLVFANVKVDGVPLKATDPVLQRIMDMSNEERTLTVETELLPFLESVTSHMTDSDASRFCHACRDVIEFLVSKSPAFRLKRSLSEAFRSVAVQYSVSKSALQELLMVTNLFDAEDVKLVLEGVPPQLDRKEFFDVMEQLFGDNPQDVSEFIAATINGRGSTGATASAEGQHEVFQLRRNRLLANLRHAFDGLVIDSLVAFGNQTDVLLADELLKDLVWIVSCLAGGPQCETSAIDWMRDATKDEVAAYQLLQKLLGFKNSTLPLSMVSLISSRLNDPRMDPVSLLPKTAVGNALATWALAAAQLLCHQRRLLFPPAMPLQPRPPSAKSEEHPRRGRGFSSPHALQKFADEVSESQKHSAETEESNSTNVAVVERFEPKLRHLTNDLQVTDQRPGRLSLKEHISNQAASNSDSGVPTPAPATASVATPVASDSDSGAPNGAAAPAAPSAPEEVVESS